MSSSEETNHDILLIIAVALVILFITNLDAPGQRAIRPLVIPIT